MTTEPLWWRIFWPIMKTLFFGLCAVLAVLDVLLFIQAARR